MKRGEPVEVLLVCARTPHGDLREWTKGYVFQEADGTKVEVAAADPAKPERLTLPPASVRSAR